MELGAETTWTIITFVIVLILAGLVALERNQNIKRQQRISQEIVDAIGSKIVVLDSDKRYILSLPSDLSTEEFDEAFTVMKNSLGLDTSKTHLVIVHGEVRLVEFS